MCDNNKANTVIERNPDVEVLFEFNNMRKHPAIDGYSPNHLIAEDYLTAGVHHYYNAKSVSPNETATGTITFITPELYPHTLWVDKIINIQEGSRVVGKATILKIFNPILNKD